ncbi:MAG: 1-acyl-sn-glycerol-3-phosphate acyltransferase [Candidatus Saccharibacteria bacterium]
MKRPEVTMENYQAVYDYYDQRGPNTNFAHLGHFLMRKAFHPDVSFAPDAQQVIAEKLSNGAQVIIVTNHDSDVDQYNLASMVNTKGVFAPMVGKTVIMAKPQLFSMAGKAGRLQRMAIDELGSYPVFRASDGVGEKGSPQRFLQRRASDSSIQLGLNKTGRDKYHLAGFPEGRRTLVARVDDTGFTHPGEDHTKVRTLSRGFGILYENLLDLEREVLVVSAGMAYGHDDSYRNLKDPTVFIGQPIVEKISDPNEFTEQLRANMQRDLTMAYDIHSRRPPTPAEQ